jgi:hypothetical protein
MRDVVHLAVNAESSGIRRRREGRNDATRMRQIGIRWRKARIDGGHLIGMNGDTSNEAVPSRNPAAFC